MKKRPDVIYTCVFFIIACLVLSTINTIYKVIPLTQAQTNADVLSTNNNSATNGTMTNSIAPTTNEGLQINKVKYFDNVSGYLVYPSASAITSSTATAGKKLPAVIMIHEYWGLNDNIKNMARTLAKQKRGYASFLLPRDHEQVRHAYCGNGARLRALKRRFDPDGVFASVIPLPV